MVVRLQLAYSIEHDFEDKKIVSGELHLFRAMWHNSNDNLFIVKHVSNGVYIIEKSNRSLEQTFHLEPGQFDGLPLESVLDKETHRKIASRYDECIEKGIPMTYEEVHTIDDSGERFWITTILPVTDTKGSTTRILGISREVTPIRNAEKALRRYSKMLELQVEERTAELQQALQKMELLAVTDKLTQLFNRHKIDEVLASEISRSERYKTTFGIILLDIDDFKHINDTFGHHTGDLVIQELAAILSKHVRGSDITGRWGGEEFIIIMPESDKGSVLQLARRLKEVIQDHLFDNVKHVTASFGTTLYFSHDTPERFINRVDEALYEAKSSGKNCVCFK